MDTLKIYAEKMAQMKELQAELGELQARLQTEVAETGEQRGYGYAALYKAGRKSTDHKAAATAANVAPELIEKYSTVTYAVAWAQVTKAAKIDVAPFTTESAPVFVVEAIK